MVAGDLRFTDTGLEDFIIKDGNRVKSDSGIAPDSAKVIYGGDGPQKVQLRFDAAGSTHHLSLPTLLLHREIFNTINDCTTLKLR